MANWLKSTVKICPILLSADARLGQIQSGASSLAKHGGAYFSAVYGFIQDPIAAPGLFDIQVP